MLVGHDHSSQGIEGHRSRSRLWVRLMRSVTNCITNRKSGTNPRKIEIMEFERVIMVHLTPAIDTEPKPILFVTDLISSPGRAIGALCLCVHIATR